MGSEEVGVVRGVGKRAAWVLRRMAAGEGGWGMDGLLEVEEKTAAGDEGRIGYAEEDGIAEKDGVANGVETHALTDEKEDTALLEARKRAIASLDSAGPTEPDLVGKKVADQLEKENEASIEPQINAVANGPAKTEENDQHSVHATLDMIVTIIGECYGQRDLLDGRLLWEEIEWMTS